MQPAVIFDMDGTLADVSAIRHHVVPIPPNRRKDFDTFHDLSAGVPAHDWVVNLARDAKTIGLTVLIVTARSTKWRNHTAMWLALNDVPSDAMFMRKNGDTRKDVLVKTDILNAIRTRFEVVMAVDDNPSILQLWQDNNITTVEVPGWQH